MTEMNHMDYLEKVVAEDVRHLQEKERTYGGSWKKRGGIGAFMMLARKWDRLEKMVEEAHWDVFVACICDMSGKDGSAIAEIRDLRRYLLLVESEMLATQERARATVHNVRSNDTLEVSGHRDDNGKVVVDEVRLVPRYDPVPAEDSNRHADRALSLNDLKAFRRDKDGTVVPRSLISANIYRALSDSAKQCFVLLGNNAIADRNRWTQEEKEVATRYPLTATEVHLNQMPLWIHEMYEPRMGVPNEVQLKEQYRELWGR